MILYILGNESHSNENDISSYWQKKSISGASLEPSIQPQYIVSLDLWYKLIYYPSIQKQRHLTF